MGLIWPLPSQADISPGFPHSFQGEPLPGYLHQTKFAGRQNGMFGAGFGHLLPELLE
jgi:hypothetical protein